ncbi:MAG: hypothetical protein U1F57_08370 [bacterium]
MLEVRKISFISALLFLFVGCSGPGSDPLGGNTGGNPATRPTPGFTELQILPATSLTLPAPGAFLKALMISEGNVEVEEVRVAVKDLQLKNGDISETDLKGPFVVRLIQKATIVDEALPSFGTVSVPEGNYTRLKLTLDKLPQNEVPAEALTDSIVTSFLVDNSVVVEGSFLESPGNDIDQSGGVSMIPFRFVSNNGNSLEIDTTSPFTLSPGLNFLFVAFKIQLWFNASVVDALQQLNPSALQNGIVLLNDQSDNSQIRQIVDLIETQIEQSLRFAPSDDDHFEENEVDDHSSSGKSL